LAHLLAVLLPWKTIIRLVPEEVDELPLAEALSCKTDFGHILNDGDGPN